MNNPALIEVVRSGFVESVHHGALVITAPDGSVRFAAGDVDSPVYPRSSNKPLQALGMLRAGLEIDDADLALACASHNGEPGHVDRALVLLSRHGLAEADLLCPPDYPLHEESRLRAVRHWPDRRRAAMNCSGKHAAMLATCRQRRWACEDYIDPKHELQRVIAETVVERTGEPIAATGVDGCAAPLFAYSLTGLARAFGRLVGAEDGPERRVADAMRAHPWLVAGTGREDTLLMLTVDGLLVKGGAEGVHAMALPDGTAVALKVSDGAARPRSTLLVTVLERLGALPDNEAARSVLDGLRRGEVLGGGRPVGELRPTAQFQRSLDASSPQ
ncbi:asparaginase [Amycolatopsis arida]|uniref:Asparaginase n=1 Tax=Amycolatopsis arida TaxID=587909 RepID=A0A1I5SVV0_9PSEU|nr:asparaginase [Amycolatopsis arida]TDX96327.1 asparaginase [Amycolatopsis arida]SFP74883.1 asparaginase [Amycolatopsis arida]